MAIPASSSMQTLLKERKYPFVLLTATLLLIFLTLLLSFSSSTGGVPLFRRPLLFSSSDLRVPASSPTPPPVAPSPDLVLSTRENVPASSSSSSPAPLDDWDPSQAEAARFKWALCEGPLATDYIPCLDNYEAIKALKSRRHMEHRERHCPIPAPRCLVPIPKGYKVPIPWPKSREMVSFIT